MKTPNDTVVMVRGDVTGVILQGVTAKRSVVRVWLDMRLMPSERDLEHSLALRFGRDVAKEGMKQGPRCRAFELSRGETRIDKKKRKQQPGRT